MTYKSAFTRHIKALTELGSKASQAQLNRKLAQAFIRFSRKTYENRTSPGGRAWKRRTMDYPWRPLEKTGYLRWSISMRNVKANSKGFTLANLPHTFSIHQYGVEQSNIPARPMIPTRRLPALLKIEWEEIQAEHVRKRLKKK